MIKKIIWWPLSCRDGCPNGSIVLMRYDWPDERILQVGILDRTKFGEWHDGRGNILQAPDYFTPMNDDVIRWLKIPEAMEYTYSPKQAHAALKVES